ncbi:MAG: hypothetical protein AB8F34_03915 [Akkermansiaceae bacterium]
MKTRQFVFNDEKVAEFVSKNFVSVAASDVDYNNLPEDAKRKGEFQFLRTALTEAPNGIHQGIYVVTPSGKFLQRCNAGWPHIDTRKCHDLLKDALSKYQSMPKESRLADQALPLDERSMHRKDMVQPASDWIKIRTTTRSYPFEPMELFDQRHPDYYKLDRLWLTPQTARTLVPGKLAVGEVSEISGRALDHLVRDNHMMLGCPPWNDASIKQARLKVKITARKGSLYQVRYEGDFQLDSDSKWNKAAYRGKLLGKAVWDEEKKKFRSLKWVSLGEHNQRELRKNETRGNVHVTKVGSLFELDPMLPNDRGITPHRWEYGYSREMKAQVKR